MSILIIYSIQAKEHKPYFGPFQSLLGCMPTQATRYRYLATVGRWAVHQSPAGVARLSQPSCIFFFFHFFLFFFSFQILHANTRNCFTYIFTIFKWKFLTSYGDVLEFEPLPSPSRAQVLTTGASNHLCSIKNRYQKFFNIETVVTHKQPISKHVYTTSNIKILYKHTYITSILCKSLCKANININQFLITHDFTIALHQLFFHYQQGQLIFIELIDV